MDPERAFADLWRRVSGSVPAPSTAPSTLPRVSNWSMRTLGARLSLAQRSAALHWIELRARLFGSKRPWEPRRLLSVGSTLKLRYDIFRMQAREAGEPHPELFAVLEQFGDHGGGRAEAYRQVIDERRSKLAATLARGTADVIGGYLAEEFMVSLVVDGKLSHDDRRRAAGAWAAIIAPSVALREVASQLITIDHLTTLVGDWLATGATSDAMDAALSRSAMVRAFADHPARYYDLVCDQGELHELASGDVMFGLVCSIGLPLAAFARTVELLGGQRQPMTADAT